MAATPENAAKLHAALSRFGFGELAPPSFELAVPDKVFMLGRKPWRIDILTGIDGVTFDEAWKERVAVDFHGLRLFIIGKQSLIRNKRASGRKKDLVDLALLEEFVEE